MVAYHSVSKFFPIILFLPLLDTMIKVTSNANKLKWLTSRTNTITPSLRNKLKNCKPKAFSSALRAQLGKAVALRGLVKCGPVTAVTRLVGQVS